MNIRNIIFIGLFSTGFLLSACDLQPKISAFPDSVGDFISNRYPALLADPDTSPEIYNAAATDYGVYSDASVYGNDNVSDYVLYSDIDDYSAPLETIKPARTAAIIPEKKAPIITEESKVQTDFINVPVYNVQNTNIMEIVVVSGDTLYSISRKYFVPINDLAVMNKLSAPFALNSGQKIIVPKTEIARTPVPVITAPVATKNVNVPLEITVLNGDTLYSISRKYFVPVSDIKDLNKLSAPYNLRAGQKLKLKSATQIMAPPPAQIPSVIKKEPLTVQKTPAQKTVLAPAAAPEKPVKLSSAPAAALPKIAARTNNNKFSWPVRGALASDFGAKPNGLYNDGINILAPQGTSVMAAENGVVAYAGNEVKGMGNLVIIQHTGGWMTVYAHLDSFVVRRGAGVVINQKIGTVGKTGKALSPQLHFEIRKGSKAYNPELYLKK